MGIKSNYEDPLARAVTGNKMTGELHGSANCEAPPEAEFCFIVRSHSFFLCSFMFEILLYHVVARSWISVT